MQNSKNQLDSGGAGGKRKDFKQVMKEIKELHQIIPQSIIKRTS